MGYGRTVRRTSVLVLRRAALLPAVLMLAGPVRPPGARGGESDWQEEPCPDCAKRNAKSRNKVTRPGPTYCWTCQVEDDHVQPPTWYPGDG